jgi:site-specific DNA-cytosine methylase
VDDDYDVIRIDLKHGEDVRLMKLPNKPIYGILAAPPCTVFAGSGNRWERTDDDMREGLSIVDACCRLVLATRPKWWALENPVGKLVHYLGPPR